MGTEGLWQTEWSGMPAGEGAFEQCPESYLPSGSSENSPPPCTHRVSLPLGLYMFSLLPLLPGPRSLPRAPGATRWNKFKCRLPS